MWREVMAASQWAQCFIFLNVRFIMLPVNLRVKLKAIVVICQFLFDAFQLFRIQKLDIIKSSIKIEQTNNYINVTAALPNYQVLSFLCETKQVTLVVLKSEGWRCLWTSVWRESPPCCPCSTAWCDPISAWCLLWSPLTPAVSSPVVSTGVKETALWKLWMV